MTIEVSLALLSFSVPATALILRLIPKRHADTSFLSKYVTTREFDGYKTELGDRLVEIQAQIRELCNHVKSRLP